MSTSPSDPRLAAYPRPVDDNGMGMHFRLNLLENEGKPYITQGVALLKEINAKWALIPCGDWLQLAIAAKPIWGAGIMPLARLVCKIDRPFIDWESAVKVLHDIGAPAYVQVFNEPGDDREWSHKPDIAKFGDKWADGAARVFDAGGYPGLQVLGKDEFDAAINSLLNNGRRDVLQRAWFCLHNAGSNHPINYPYDDVNQLGTPETPAGYALEHYTLSLDELNKKRKSDAHPGATILTDDTSAIRLLEYKQWMIDSLGFCLPIIGGESGWTPGAEEDLRYAKLSNAAHAQLHKEMYQWFATGKLSNGDPLPDELFSVSPWLMADGGAASWWFGPLGTLQQTIDAVKTIPPFVRKFGGNVTPPPIPVPPIETLEQAVLAIAQSVKWMPVNNTAALWIYAKAHGLQDQQSDELAMNFNGKDYIVQVFNLGIVYAPKDNVNNVTVIPK